MELNNFVKSNNKEILSFVNVVFNIFINPLSDSVTLI